MDKVLKAVAVIIGFLIGWWAGLSPVVQVLIVVMAFDIVTGAIRAAKDHAITTDKAFWGVTKKVLILILVGVCSFIGQTMGNAGLGDAAAMYYVYSEGMSALDNLAALGVPFPDWLKAIFQNLSGHKPEGGQ
jgi:toxin secretion/phage lysis holin